MGNWDDIVRTGEWAVGRTAPMALGVEAAGVVKALGTGVEGWAEGDEVLTHPVPLADQGAWAPWLIAPAKLLAAKPPNVDWGRAGAFPVPALTAVQALDALRVRPGETLLVNGAGSVTGGLIVALAASQGVEVAATAGPSSSERVRSAGASIVLDYHDPNWPEQLCATTGGHGVHAAANTARGQAWAAMAAVRDGGRLATITSDPPPQARDIAVSSVYVRPDAAQLAVAGAALGASQLPFVLGAQFALEDAPFALARAVSGSGGAVALLL
ncbi:MAG: zinc-binding dehydrogenase [Solirubrobacterales bacterium]|nr:zinc-binding dehydrogenase [Solirubrobacterales bacterium]